MKKSNKIDELEKIGEKISVSRDASRGTGGTETRGTHISRDAKLKIRPGTQIRGTQNPRDGTGRGTHIFRGTRPFNTLDLTVTLSESNSCYLFFSYKIELFEGSMNQFSGVIL